MLAVEAVLPAGPRGRISCGMARSWRVLGRALAGSGRVNNGSVARRVCLADALLTSLSATGGSS